MVGGVLGNVLSAAWNGLAVPDPIIVFSPHAVIAFNLADVFASIGILTLTGVLATALIRNRHVLSTREDARAALQRSHAGGGSRFRERLPRGKNPCDRKLRVPCDGCSRLLCPRSPG